MEYGPFIVSPLDTHMNPATPTRRLPSSLSIRSMWLNTSRTMRLPVYQTGAPVRRLPPHCGPKRVSQAGEVVSYRRGWEGFQ
jgi:hypothetical protein